MQPAVSIITVYYNAPDDLIRLFDSMQKYLHAESFEWIIADNNSKEDLSGRFPGAKYLRFSENLGFGKANNRAAEQVSGEFLFFVNPDCVFIHDCVTPLIQASVDADILGPAVLNTDKSLQLSFGPFLSISAEAKQKWMTQHESSNYIQGCIASHMSGSFHPDYVSGCALFMSAALFKELHGFDEDYFLYNEDVDLCYRAKQMGKKVLYVPFAAIVHERNTSMSASIRQHYQRSQELFYRKHRGTLSRFALKMYKAISR